MNYPSNCCGCNNYRINCRNFNETENYVNNEVFENRNRSGRYKNKAYLAVDLCNKRHLIESNEVEFKKVALRLRKEESCDFAFAGDSIEYRIKIDNDSCMKFFNVEFKDELPDDTYYERGSFEVNGRCVNPEIIGEKTLYYRIPEIKENSETVIKFKAKVR